MMAGSECAHRVSRNRAGLESQRSLIRSERCKTMMPRTTCAAKSFGITRHSFKRLVRGEVTEQTLTDNSVAGPTRCGAIRDRRHGNVTAVGSRTNACTRIRLGSRPKKLSKYWVCAWQRSERFL